MNRLSRHLARPLMLVAAIALVAACGTGPGDLGSVATPPPTSAPSVDVPSPEPTPGTSPTASPGGSVEPSPTPTPAGTTTIRAYFFLGSFTDDSGLVPVLRVVPKTQAVATAAMNALIAGPNEAELAARPAMYTTVPEGTRLLGLTIENGVATVDLSREFESGGGTAAVVGRLAQVVYTLTQFPTVQTVRFELDGEPVTVFSGEGVLLDHPVGRDDYRDQLPPIWVDRPAWGAALGNPGRVTGVSNVFEATHQVAILDADGDVLADETVMATCGTGCWGTFDVTLDYSVGSAQWGILRVYAYSAKDGTPVDIVDYPVWLTPAG